MGHSYGLFQTFYELLEDLKKRKTQNHCTEAVDLHSSGFMGFFDVDTSEMFLVRICQTFLEVEAKDGHHWPKVGFTRSDLGRLLKTPEGRTQIFGNQKR